MAKKLCNIAVAITAAIGVGVMVGAGMWYFSTCDAVDILVIAPFNAMLTGAGVASYLDFLDKGEAK